MYFKKPAKAIRWLSILFLGLALLFVPASAFAENFFQKYKTDSAGSYDASKGHSAGSSGVAPKPREGSGSKHGYKGHGKGSGHRGGYSHSKKEGSGSKHGYKGHADHHKASPFEHILHFSKSLGLSDAQVNNLEWMEIEYKKHKILLRAEHKFAHMELDQVVHSGELQENWIRAIGRWMGSIKARKAYLLTEAKIAILKSLTEQQRKNVRAMYSRH